MRESLNSLEPESASDSIPSRLALRHLASGTALTILPIALWCLTHRYRGLVGDSELYAVQALSRAHTGLARDVFLSGASQDRYTTFSPIYAFFIKHLGLQQAAISLLVLSKVCLYISAWAISRKLFDARAALLTLALLIVVPIEYGAFHVFRVAEDMLTARSIAEALALAGLCLHIYGRRNAGLALAVLALSIHALIALPMVLLLLSLRLGTRSALRWALVAIAVVLCMALAATWMPEWTPPALKLMDPNWLEVVRERSQFVFLQLWRRSDWEANARPFLCLAISVLVFPDERVRTLCASAMIVGAAGLAIALIGGTIGLVALLLQGQAWRWTWVTGLASVLMLGPTVLQIWRSERCGPLCGVLLLVGWMVPVMAGAYLVAAALCLWLGRAHIPTRASPYLRAAAVLIGMLVFARIIGTAWSAVSARPPGTATESTPLPIARMMMSLECVPVVLAFLVGSWALRARSITPPAALALGLAAVTALAAPAALENPLAEGTAAQIEEFSDWRDAIPPSDNVLVLPRYYTAGFAWFTLQRPSYLTVDQSSGVIFSRVTALEVRRRSQVLLPLEEPDWRLLSRRAAHGGKFDASALPLTRERLVRICTDPELNFVVAKEDVGFNPIRHHRRGIWDGWLLYDCKQVNPPGQSR